MAWHLPLSCFIKMLGIVKRAQRSHKTTRSRSFDGPKPVRLLNRLLILANLKDDSIVLDFFSGSAQRHILLCK